MGMSFESRTYLALSRVDNLITKPLVRLGNHAAAIISLSCFGLISTTMMTAMKPTPFTIAGAIMKNVGPTSNRAFSQYFATLVTPANYVFLIWPVIAALQLVTVALSILRPERSRNPLLRKIAGSPLAQSELTALTLANAAACAWLLVSSNAAAGALPLGSLLALPVIPLFAAYPLRASANTLDKWFRPVFQVFSSFTLIASLLALAVELQYGGRLPIPGVVGNAELAGCVFAAGVGAIVSLPNRCLARRAVSVLALSGVLVRRVNACANPFSSPQLLTSPSFVAILAAFVWAVLKLLNGGNRMPARRVVGTAPPGASLGRPPLPPPPTVIPDDDEDRPGFGERGWGF